MENLDPIKAINDVDLTKLTAEELEQISNPVLRPIVQKALQDRDRTDIETLAGQHLLYSMAL